MKRRTVHSRAHGAVATAARVAHEPGYGRVQSNERVAAQARAHPSRPRLPPRVAVVLPAAHGRGVRAVHGVLRREGNWPQPAALKATAQPRTHSDAAALSVALSRTDTRAPAGH